MQSNRADYAFVQHAVASLLPEGRVVVIMPVSTLSRSGFEEEIRAGLVHADILSASASFQGDMLLSKQTPAAVLLFDLAKQWDWRDSVFFVDAPFDLSPSRGESSTSGPDVMSAIAKVIWSRREEPGLSKTTGLSEIKARQYNLAPQAYVERQGPKHVEVQALDQKIETTTRELREAQEAFQTAILTLKEERRLKVGKKVPD